MQWRSEDGRRRIGLRLRSLRDAKGWTMAELADMTGLHYLTIGRLEAGKHSARHDTLVLLAKVYGLEWTDLTGWRVG